MPSILIDHDVELAQEWFGGTVAGGRLFDGDLTAKAWRDVESIVTANVPNRP